VPSARQHLFSPEPTQGSLRCATGERVAALSTEFVQTLHVTLVDQFAENAQDVLYRSGYDWGLQDLLRLTQELKAKLGVRTDIWQMDVRFILESWWAPLAEAGWGRAAFELGSLTRGVVFVELRESAVVSALGPSDQPVCHWYAGLFAGALSFVERAERHCVEVQCGALGAPTCQFIVAPGADIDSAETWRQQGTDAAEIIRRLR
jgi:uncharacterized protein